MTSVPIWSVLPHINVDESSMEMVQPYHGKHFLMDLIHQSPLKEGSDTQSIIFPNSVPYLFKNVVTKSLSSLSPKQMTSECTLSSNDDSCLLVDSQPFQTPKNLEMNISQHVPPIIESQNQLLENINLKSKKLSNLPIYQTLNVKKHPIVSLQSGKLSLDSTNPKVGPQDETVSSDIPDEETNQNVWESTKFGEFFCPICDTNYWSADFFSSHLEGKEFSCRICMTEFSSHSDLKMHFLSHRGYRCGDCEKYFLCKEDLSNHRKSSLTCISKFECNICNKMYNSEQSVKKHRQDVHQSIKSMYNCIVCDNKFTLPFKLNSHLKRYHVAYENIECTLCSMSVLGPEKLKIHKRLYHLRKKEPSSCSNCGKVFYCKDSLIRHEKSHYDIDEIVCEFCGKSCKGSRALSEHIQYNHKDVRQINCKSCNKEFKSMKCLRRHENTAHKPKIPVVCEICGKTLKNREQLKTHLQIHSSERQFKCDICSATFKQALALRNHSRIHSSFCKYNCSNCGKSFKWKQTYDKHIDKCPVTLNSLSY